MRYTSVHSKCKHKYVVQVINASNWLVIGFLCTESLALISEETDQPHILPQLFRCFALFEFILSLIALIVFFPFVLRIKFEEDTLLPLAFDSISIFSARFLKFLIKYRSHFLLDI